MRVTPLAAAIAAAILSGCAASPEMITCLQPNRRVSVEIVGTKVKPPPKPKPGEKAAKPEMENVELSALAQGNEAWDVGSAVLKDSGKSDIDDLLNIVRKGEGKDTRPTGVGAIIITGHTDRYEAADSGKADLDVQRAITVRDYLVSKGMEQKLMYWEGKGAKEPIPVTKFCD